MNPIPRKGHPIKPSEDVEGALKALNFKIDPNRAIWETDSIKDLTQMMAKLKKIGFNSGVVSW